MTNEEVQKRMFELQEIIMKAENELAGLRAGCDHSQFTACIYSTRPGAFHPERVCDFCGAVVSGITDEESEKIWKEWEK